MSVILGMLNLDGGEASEESVRTALAGLAFLGGKEGFWHEGQLALGCHLLPVTAASQHEVQPCSYGDLVGVADARIDNRRELGAQLGLMPTAYEKMPDSALILRAVARWGNETPSHLIGDFAFAVWDRKMRRLCCARDHIGTRPFYYYHASPIFLFASDIRGLLAFDQVADDIDEDEVARYLRNPLTVSIEKTFFKEITKLPFAHQLQVDAKGLRKQQYWKPGRQSTLRLKDDRSYAEALRDLIAEAVACRADTNFPVATHLSGGLDSTAITVMAARHLRERGEQLATTFTWSPAISEAFPEGRGDERKRIEAVCRQEQVMCHYPVITPEDYRALFDLDVGVNGTLGLINEWMILKQAQTTGVRTILSGWGGDEAATYDGRGYLSALFLQGRWMEGGRRLRQQFGRRPRRLLGGFVHEVLLPMVPSPVFDWVNPMAEQKLPPAFVHPDFKARARPFRERSLRLLQERVGVRAMQRALFDHGHLAQRMEGWAAWASPRGIEYSYPLTDRRVLAFIYAVPPDLFWKKGHLRYLFRLAMEGILPPEVQWEGSKYDYGVELRRNQLRMGLWHLLAQEVQQGVWDRMEVPWIDMPLLKQAMLDVPDRLDRYEVFRFERILSAVEMCSLWRHHGA